MLLSLTSPLVVFCDFNSAELILQTMRNQKKRTKKNSTKISSNIVIYIYDSIWQLFFELADTRNLQSSEMIYKYIYEQKKIDPESKYHTASLYAVWNVKAFVCDQVASKLNPFKSKFFIYSDMGAWREKSMPGWPDISFVNLLQQSLNNRMLLGLIKPIKINQCRNLFIKL